MSDYASNIVLATHDQIPIWFLPLIGIAAVLGLAMFMLIISKL